MKIVNTINEAIPVLVVSVMQSDLPMVNALLDKFPKLIELRDKRGRTLLMMAAYLGDPSVINYLVSFFIIANPKLDPNAEDEDGLSAHDWAVLGGNEFARSLLLKVMDLEDEQ